jgi:hypothetical protein
VRLSCRFAIPFVAVLLVILLPVTLLAQGIVMKGRVTDPQGNGLPKASVQLVGDNQVFGRATSGPDGLFEIEVGSTGQFIIKVDAAGFRTVTHSISVRPSGNSDILISMGQVASRIENITVTADVNETDVLTPDPAQRIFVRQDLLDANPGRPGAPVSIPGYPIETASSGIKAPQYFAPGVAGDHGEPIAQFIAVGSYLVPNNLSANAHGNGYSDPNVFIPEVLQSVQVDGGAFNVKGTIPSTWRRHTECALAWIRSPPSREITATSMWWRDSAPHPIPSWPSPAPTETASSTAGTSATIQVQRPASLPRG